MLGNSLFRSLRLSFLPPLMVYVAAGISGLTGIVGTFFVKEYLGLSAEFLAALGFWIVLPWTLKMPVGHVVDLVWRWKESVVFLGAAFLAASICIMLGLLTSPQEMRAIMPAERWYVLAALLSPIGYMLQDVVADAMTVEGVAAVSGVINHCREFRRCQTHGVEPQLDEIVAVALRWPADCFPGLAQSGAGLKRFAACIKAFHTGCKDVAKLLWRRLADIDGVFGVNEITAILRVPFRHDDVVFFQWPAARHHRLIHAVEQVPQLVSGMVDGT